MLEAQESVNRLRMLSLELANSAPAERIAKLRAEVMEILSQSPKSERAGLLKQLASAFPVWPIDLPPPAFHLSELQKLRNLMPVEGQVHISGERAIDAFVCCAQALETMDRMFREFLQQSDLAQFFIYVPSFAKSVEALLTRPAARDATSDGLAQIRESCQFLMRVATVLMHSSDSYARNLAQRFAPDVIEQKFTGKNAWAEYIHRLNDQKDVEGCKAEFLFLLKQNLQRTLELDERVGNDTSR